MLKKPEQYTQQQWDSILAQADEWGYIFTMGYPNTSYDSETKIWDYTNEPFVCEKFGVTKEGKGQFCTIHMAQIAL